MSTIDLKLQLESYLTLKTSLGYSMRAERTLLKNFIEYLEDKNISNSITSQLAVEWSCSRSTTISSNTQSIRLSIVRRFLYYLQAYVPETQVPEHSLLKRVSRSIPFIYSHKDVEKLIDATSLLGPKDSLRPFTFKTIIGLLISCGLRIGEAIRLKNSDVILNKEPSQILIRNTKFRKSRIVPIHPTTELNLRFYIKKRSNLGYDILTDAFFVSEQGKHLHYHAVHRTFKRLKCSAGIQTTNDGRRPTIHSFRHTFAVNRLITWYEKGIDIQSQIPHLSVYMGHAEPKNTYWYLTATPKLLSLTSESFEKYANRGDYQ